MLLLTQGRETLMAALYRQTSVFTQQRAPDGGIQRSAPRKVVCIWEDRGWQQKQLRMHPEYKPSPSFCRAAAAPAVHHQRLVVAAAAGAAAGSATLHLQPHQPVVKVCGVTSADDAAVAAAAGANLIGMILWPRAKRSVGAATARDIAAAARRHRAEPVGVFVDEDAAIIERVCAECDVRIAQLHGDGARAALPHLPPGLAVIYVLHADKSGHVQTPLPAQDCRQPHWLIVDSLQGGSGESFDWRQLRAQAAGLASHSSHGWLLAGGLTPETVAEAIATAGPTGVDVSSGVCGPDGLKKDAGKVQQYCGGAHAAFAGASGSVPA